MSSADNDSLSLESKADESPLSTVSVPTQQNMRQSPLDVTVVTPSGKRILVSSVNPSEPTSFIKQALQDFQESAHYTNYAFETVDGVKISDYVELANYAPVDEEVTSMTICLVAAQYDIKKSRLQLKRVRDMIAYPPTMRGFILDPEVTSESSVKGKEVSSEGHAEDSACKAEQGDEETKGGDCESATNEIEKKSSVSVEEIAAETLVAEAEVAVEVKEEEVTVQESVAEEVAAETEVEDVKEESAVADKAESEGVPEEKASEGAIDAEEAAEEGDDEEKNSDIVSEHGELEEHLEATKDEIPEPTAAEIVQDVVLKEVAVRAAAVEEKQAEERGKEMDAEKARKAELAAKRSKLPSATEIFSPISLSSFFHETLSRTSASEGETKAQDKAQDRAQEKGKDPSECVKSISASGWNPPPLNRRAQGDLLYIEAVTEEGIFHMTSTPKGFFVNKSTRHLFDPSPAKNPHFSHELFLTLLGVSASLRASWHQLCSNTPAGTHDRTDSDYNSIYAGEGAGAAGDKLSGALDVVSILYSQGREDLMFLRPQWNVPPAGSSKPATMAIGKEVDRKQREDITDIVNTIENAPRQRGSTGNKHASHVSNYSRVHDDLCDQFGAEEPGAPREWNEEMQSMRDFSSQEINDKVMKAKYVHKIYQEFTEAVGAGALAIADGHIAPMNPADEEKTQVYVYNNIFYSRAVDTKENFKICTGDEANRKLAGHDIKNQRLIQSLNVTGLSTVLSCVVDFKGERLIGQTIIPGVLQVGIHSARLLYGTLEQGKRLSVKVEGLQLMNALYSRLHVVQRNIKATPTIAVCPPEEEAKEPPAPAVPAGLGFFGSMEEEEDKASGVQIDKEDEVVEVTSEVVPHLGCLEMKVLRGTDGRAYALDAMRLTPRDANYVKSPKGTGNIGAETLYLVNGNIALTYVLRHELISAYVQHKAQVLRQEMIQKELLSKRDRILKKEKEVEQKRLADIEKAEGEKLEKIEDGKVVKEEVGGAIVVKEGAAVETKKEKEEEEKEEKTEEEKKEEKEEKEVKEVSIEDKEREEAEERESDYFSSDPTRNGITADSVRLELNTNCFIEGFECDEDPAVALKDEEATRSLADFLYKQVLVSLTEQVRVGDLTPLDNEGLVELLHSHGVNMRYLGTLSAMAEGQERQDRELLLTNRQRIQAMPAYWLEMIEIEILARCFKHHLGRLFRENREIKHCPAPTIATLLNHILGTEGTGGSPFLSVASVSMDSTGDEKDGSSLKLKKKRKSKHDKESNDCSPMVPETQDAGGSRGECVAAIQRLAASRFGTSFSLVNLKEGEGEEKAPLLGSRMSKLTLLRRLCQVAGLRIVSRDFDFSSPLPFEDDDIVSVMPLVKSSQQLVPIPEVREIITASRAFLEEGNLTGAFELAQDASQLLHQITGPLHKETAMSVDLITNVLLEAGDNVLALTTACKSLSISVQLTGLDSQDAAQHHGQVAALLADLGRPLAAVQHLLSMKYLVELMGGARHPELVNVYLRLVGVYDELGDYTTAQALLAEAKTLCTDVAKQCMITATVAEIFDKQGEFSKALSEQRGVLRTMEQLFGGEDLKTVDAKLRVQRYLRKLTVDNVNTARELIASKELATKAIEKGDKGWDAPVAGKKKAKRMPAKDGETTEESEDGEKDRKEEKKKSKKSKKSSKRK